MAKRRILLIQKALNQRQAMIVAEKFNLNTNGQQQVDVDVRKQREL